MERPEIQGELPKVYGKVVAEGALFCVDIEEIPVPVTVRIARPSPSQNRELSPVLREMLDNSMEDVDKLLRSI